MKGGIVSAFSPARLRKVFVATVAGVFLAVTLGAGSSTAASPQSSCVGILVSFVATTDSAGTVSDLTRMFHQQAKDAGVPPGSGDAALAKLHLGDPLACF
jgi:hypothetical protein